MNNNQEVNPITPEEKFDAVIRFSEQIGRFILRLFENSVVSLNDIANNTSANSDKFRNM